MNEPGDLTVTEAVIQIASGALTAEALESAGQVSAFEFARALTYELTHHTDKLSKVLREGRAAEGLDCTYERYAEGRAVVAECRRQLELPRMPIFGRVAEWEWSPGVRRKIMGQSALWPR